MPHGIKILVANYGGKDVTNIAKQQHKSNAHFVASNSYFGDPLPGTPKFLHVIYSFHGVLGSVSIPEPPRIMHHALCTAHKANAKTLITELSISNYLYTIPQQRKRNDCDRLTD